MTDIEQRVAAALEQANRFGFAELRMDNGDRMVPANIGHYVKTYLVPALAADGLRVVPDEVADVGEAVLRLPEYMAVERYNDEWHVYENTRQGICVGHAPTLPAAIDAALEQRP